MQVLIAKIVESYNPAHGQPTKKAPSGDKGKSRRFEWFFTPVLGPLLLNRWLIGIFLGVGLTQLILVASGLTGWQCPIKSTFSSDDRVLMIHDPENSFCTMGRGAPSTAVMALP